jgi:DNA-binding response OmpR family regulator
MPTLDSTVLSRISCCQAGLRSSVNILIVSTHRHDQAALRRILRHSHFVIAGAGSCREALDHLGRVHSAIVFCDYDLPDGTWLDILNCVTGPSDSSFLIVTSRLADERLWAEVLNLGGFDLLAKPFEAAEVLHVVKTALLRQHDSVAAASVGAA